jgi:predicted aspartyl protease
MLVDTGSSYSTISSADLENLQRQERAHFVRELTGVMADGRELIVPIYRLSSIAIGQNCWLHDVEAAVFPQQVRNILGLSALLKAAPFTFSLDPPALILSNCLGAPTLPLAIVPAENDEPVADTTPAVSVTES